MDLLDKAGDLVTEHGGAPWVGKVGREVCEGGGAGGDGLWVYVNKEFCDNLMNITNIVIKHRTPSMCSF